MRTPVTSAMPIPTQPPAAVGFPTDGSISLNSLTTICKASQPVSLKFWDTAAPQQLQDFACVMRVPNSLASGVPQDGVRALFYRQETANGFRQEKYERYYYYFPSQVNAPTVVQGAPHTYLPPVPDYLVNLTTIDFSASDFYTGADDAAGLATRPVAPLGGAAFARYLRLRIPLRAAPACQYAPVLFLPPYCEQQAFVCPELPSKRLARSCGAAADSETACDMILFSLACSACVHIARCSG